MAVKKKHKKPHVLPLLKDDPPPKVFKAGKVKQWLARDFDEFKTQSETRAAWADEIIARQDADTRIAIELMVEKMHFMRGTSAMLRVTPKETGETVAMAIPVGISDGNLRYCAVRLFVQAEEWGIKIANFRNKKMKKAKPKAAKKKGKK